MISTMGSCMGTAAGVRTFRIGPARAPLLDREASRLSDQFVQSEHTSHANRTPHGRAASGLATGGDPRVSD